MRYWIIVRRQWIVQLRISNNNDPPEKCMHYITCISQGRASTIDEIYLERPRGHKTLDRQTISAAEKGRTKELYTGVRPVLK